MIKQEKKYRGASGYWKSGDGMDMSTVFLKYHSFGNDYLIYDTGRNDVMLDEKAVRAVCARNFGLGTAGILAGTAVDKTYVEMKLFGPDGSIQEAGADERYIFSSYLKDAGYPDGLEWTPSMGGGERLGEVDYEEAYPKYSEASQVGKLYLTEEFIEKNHLHRVR